MRFKTAVVILSAILLSQNLPAEESLSYLNRILGSAENSLDKNYRRLSSGTCLLPDDPANHAIYEKLEAHIREFETTISNQGDMISYYQTTESFLKHIIGALQDIRELLLKRGNFFYSDEDRGYIDSEINQYYNQILFTLKSAEFNKKRIFETLLADNILQGLFLGEEYYQLDNVDCLLSFFTGQRSMFGTMIKALEYRNQGLALESENLKAFQSSLWHIDMAAEISRLKRNHLLFIINLLLI